MNIGRAQGRTQHASRPLVRVLTRYRGKRIIMHVKAFVAILLSLVLGIASAWRGVDVADGAPIAPACESMCAEQGASEDAAADRCGADAAGEPDLASLQDCDCISCPCCVPTPRPSTPRPSGTPSSTSDWRTGLKWSAPPVAWAPPAASQSWAMELVPSTGVRALGRCMSDPEQRCVWRT